MTTKSLYSKRFRNLHKDAVLAVKSAVKAGLFTVSDVEKQAIIGILNRELSSVYSVVECSVVFKNDVASSKGNGVYSSNTITLINKFSVVTFLHEFRHHVQHQSLADDVLRDREFLEVDARGWSLSLFRKACPKSYKNACDKGLLYYK
jgi:hypothetical protein